MSLFCSVGSSETDTVSVSTLVSTGHPAAHAHTGGFACMHCTSHTCRVANLQKKHMQTSLTLFSIVLNFLEPYTKWQPYNGLSASVCAPEVSWNYTGEDKKREKVRDVSMQNGRSMNYGSGIKKHLIPVYIEKRNHSSTITVRKS